MSSLQYKTGDCNVALHVLTSSSSADDVHKALNPAMGMLARGWWTGLDLQVHEFDHIGGQADWKPCASLPFRIPTVHNGSGLYLDADVLINGRLCVGVQHLEHTLVGNTWAAIARETEGNTSWYTDSAHAKKRNCTYEYTHFLPPTGLNSGVFYFRHTLPPKFVGYAQSYRGPHCLGDQDIINGYFAQYPDEVVLLPCEWNVRTDSQCRVKPMIIHGNRGVFNDDRHSWRHVAQAAQGLAWPDPLGVLTATARRPRESAARQAWHRMGITHDTCISLLAGKTSPTTDVAVLCNEIVREAPYSPTAQHASPPSQYGRADGDGAEARIEAAMLRQITTLNTIEAAMLRQTTALAVMLRQTTALTTAKQKPSRTHEPNASPVTLCELELKRWCTEQCRASKDEYVARRSFGHPQLRFSNPDSLMWRCLPISSLINATHHSSSKYCSRDRQLRAILQSHEACMATPTKLLQPVRFVEWAVDSTAQIFEDSNRSRAPHSNENMKPLLVTASILKPSLHKGSFTSTSANLVTNRFAEFARRFNVSVHIIQEDIIGYEPLDARIIQLAKLLRWQSPTRCVFFVDATDVEPQRPFADLCSGAAISIATDVCDLSRVKSWWHKKLLRSNFSSSSALNALLRPHNGVFLPNCGVIGGQVGTLLPFVEKMSHMIQQHYELQHNRTSRYPVDTFSLMECFLQYKGAIHLGYPLGLITHPMWGKTCCNTMFRNEVATCHAKQRLDYYFHHK